MLTIHSRLVQQFKHMWRYTLTAPIYILSVVLKAQGQLCLYFDRNCKCLVNSFLTKMFRSNKDAVQRVLLLVSCSIGKYDAGLHKGLSPCAVWLIGTRR
jgi:hypothetical protein